MQSVVFLFNTSRVLFISTIANPNLCWSGFYAYDAAQVALTAVNAPKNGQSLKTILLSIVELSRLQGIIGFDACGDVKSTIASIRIVHNQNFIAME